MIEYVKIMPEIMANPIWDRDGVMMSWRTFDCPDDHLIRELIIWNNLCDREDYCPKLETVGYTLAKYVKYCFPNATVIYQYDSRLVEIYEGESMWKSVRGNI